MIDDSPGGAILTIRVVPRAGKTALAGIRDGALLIRLAAAPVDDAANAELIDLLSRVLDVAKRQIAVISGDKNRSKRVKVSGLSAARIRERLDAADAR